MNFEYYTGHAVVVDTYLILVLYPAGLHNHFIRFVSRELTECLIQSTRFVPLLKLSMGLVGLNLVVLFFKLPRPFSLK